MQKKKKWKWKSFPFNPTHCFPFSLHCFPHRTKVNRDEKECNVLRKLRLPNYLALRTIARNDLCAIITIKEGKDRHWRGKEGYLLSVFGNETMKLPDKIAPEDKQLYRCFEMKKIVRCIILNKSLVSWLIHHNTRQSYFLCNQRYQWI